MEIIATLDRFENGQAVLVLKDGSQVIWPRPQLPADAKEGDILYLQIKTEPEATKAKQKQAKDILNELLKIKPD